MKYLIAVATAALLAGTAEAGSVTISYSSAHLASDAAATSFYSTLQRASRRACREHVQMTLDEYRLDRACRAGALDRAVADIGDDRLWAIHNGAADTNVYITDADRNRIRYVRIRLVKQNA